MDILGGNFPRAILRSEHNNLKGHYNEIQVLLSLIKGIIDGKGGIAEGIEKTEFTCNLKYVIETRQETDVLL